MTSQTARPIAWFSWISLLVACASVAVVLWACLTAWGAVVHGHPAYAIALALSALGAVLLGLLSARKIRRRNKNPQADASRIGAWGVVWRSLLILLGAVWIAALAWLRPYAAIEPALAAMQSDSAVTVTESATFVELRPNDPNGPANSTGVFFQPGALVDARAYAAVLRPLAESGHTVVIAKQPLGIAFLALSAFDNTKAANPEVSQWVMAGHSLGGTVAAMQATEDESHVAGLLFFASYPANDISSTLKVPVESISGTLDGLATPAKIKASRSTLPSDTDFTVIEGASHAQFGDYGPQSGDNTPAISNDEARQQISEAVVEFVGSVGK